MNPSSEVYKKRINKVIDYVINNLDRSVSLDELAQVSFFSPYHFHRIFVAVTGETVNGFTNRVRLEKAARLLKFSKASVADIAYDCGFSSGATLSRSFKQYFELSPTSYRKSGQIENSKIRKALPPIQQYHCDMSVAEMQAKFPVEVKAFPQRRIAYLRVPNSFEEGVALKAFGELVDWAKEVGLFDSQQIFGMSKDDPLITPLEKYSYEVGITLPDNFEVKPSDRPDTMVLPPCHYAVASVSGTFNEVATATYYLFNHWLINSAYEPEHQFGMEIFRENANVCNWEHFDLDLCVPVKSTYLGASSRSMLTEKVK